jgi:hypothetical protein
LTREGICHICGKRTKLTFEHFPPHNAFNTRPVLAVNSFDALIVGPEDKLSGHIQQKGMGDFTLCESCNNKTGKMYGPFYKEWAGLGFCNILKLLNFEKPVEFKQINPLPILKQIVTFFFSINSPNFAEMNPELVEFVLNRDLRSLPKKFGFYAYHNHIGRYRTNGIGVIYSLVSKQACICSEISFPPFGYVLTIDSLPPNPKLIPLTYFSEFQYNEATDFFFDFPILPTHLSFPGDYRSEEEIRIDFEKNSEML